MFIADDFRLSDTAQQIVVASLLLGAVFGALFGGPLADRIGRRTITETGTFWLYGVFGLIGILFFFRLVPETKGRTLEEIEEELERRTSTGSDTEAAGGGSS